MNFDDIECYHCKSELLPGKSYVLVYKLARRIFNRVKLKTKRRPYIKSAYFKGEKIFLDNFWPHLNQKNPGDRKYRLRFFECALELIQKSHEKPIYKKQDILNKFNLYRFIGEKNGRYFAVQIKEDLKRKQKFFMSVFEYKK